MPQFYQEDLASCKTTQPSTLSTGLLDVDTTNGKGGSPHLAEDRNDKVISGGATARIEREDGSDHVTKVPYPHSRDVGAIEQLQREFDIYHILPQHPRFLRLLPGSTPTCLLLPYMPLGTLATRFSNKAFPPLDERSRLQLATDAAEAIALLHKASVIHCDIRPANFLLSQEQRLCVIDFAGSGLNGQDGTVFEDLRYCLPRPLEAPATEREDIFALGSLIYFIFKGQAPHSDKEDGDVEQLFSTGCYPSVCGLVCEDIILGCWTGALPSADQVYKALSALLAQH